MDDPLPLLMGIVGMVLLMACANLSGLLVTRGAARQRELSIRGALGAGRGRLVRQLFTETALVFCLGTVLGLVMTSWLKSAIAKMIWPNNPFLDLHNDAHVLGFTLFVSLLTLFVFGWVPAWRSTCMDPLAALRETASAGRLRLRLGKALVIAQVGLSLILLTSGGLLVRTLVELNGAELGFKAENLLTFRINPQSAGYQDEQAANIQQRVVTALGSLPDVTALSQSRDLLMSGWVNSMVLQKQNGSETQEIRAHAKTVGNAFLATMGIPLLRGRDFSASHNEADSVIINEMLAQQYFGDEDPLGKPFSPGTQVIGVCRDFISSNVKEGVQPLVFLHTSSRKGGGHLCYALRTDIPPAALMPMIRKAVSGIDSSVLVEDLTTQTERMRGMFKRERLFAILGCGAAVIGICLACLGLYGLQAYQVIQRTGEIGLRMALGATRTQVLLPFLRSTLVLTVMGLIVGLPVIYSAVGMIRKHIWGVNAYDPVTLVGSAIMLLMVSCLAAYIPVRRAVKIDPMEALHYE